MLGCLAGMSMLRVHSKDLHEHVASEAGECLESGLYTDLAIRCRGGETLYAHRLVLAAVSPYLRHLLLEAAGGSMRLDEPPAAVSAAALTGGTTIALDLPDTGKEEVAALLEIIYTGSVEASLEEMRSMLSLAHALYITVPVSDQLTSLLGLEPPPPPPPLPIGMMNFKQEVTAAAAMLSKWQFFPVRTFCLEFLYFK
jgi:hypothetical protein